MKIIGLIGGMSWETTIPYCREINEVVKRHKGGRQSAKLILYRVDFQEVEGLMRRGDWRAVGELLARAARVLESAGAQGLVLCTNTLHKVAPAIEAAVRIPLLHIVDPTARAIRQAGVATIGLLGTRVTMDEDFYRDLLTNRYGMQVLIPEEASRAAAHRIVFEEVMIPARWK